MGGYAGTTNFYVIWNNGFVEVFGDFERISVFASETCGKLPYVPLQIALKETKASDTASGSSIADELLRYSDLLRQGLISQEEYEQLKQRLLSANLAGFSREGGRFSLQLGQPARQGRERVAPKELLE
jgi:hypothetical protein